MPKNREEPRRRGKSSVSVSPELLTRLTRLVGRFGKTKADVIASALDRLEGTPEVVA